MDKRFLMKKFLIIYVLILLACAGCGYHVSPGGEHIDAGIRKVFIGNFVNRTSEANVENYVRNAFFDRLRKGGRFTPVSDRNLADALLTGQISGITTAHLAYSIADVTKEDSVSMTLDVVFKRADNGEVICISDGLSGREAFKVEVDTAVTAENKRNAIMKLSVDMADKAYRNIMSGF